eukprot:10611040-Prorocentrum_lima.AAC.1
MARQKKKRARGKRAGTKRQPSRRTWGDVHFGYYVTQPAAVYFTVEERMAAEAAAAMLAAPVAAAAEELPDE